MQWGTVECVSEDRLPSGAPGDVTLIQVLSELARSGYDLRNDLRGRLAEADASDPGDASLMARIHGIWSIRDDRYSASRSRRPQDDRSDRVEMHYIGG